MTLNKFIRKLLRLKDLSVVNFEFGFKKRQLHLWVKPYKNGCRCPECQRRGRILRTMDDRLWQDVPVCGWLVLFHYRPKEIWCRQHGRLQEFIPWAEAYAGLPTGSSMRCSSIANSCPRAALPDCCRWLNPPSRINCTAALLGCEKDTAFGSEDHGHR